MIKQLIEEFPDHSFEASGVSQEHLDQLEKEGYSYKFSIDRIEGLRPLPIITLVRELSNPINIVEIKKEDNNG